MLANRTNSQFIADKISSKQGVTCSSPSLMTGGGTYGVTNASLNADVEAGLGKARASSINHYSHCNSQKGGAAGHNYDADAVGQTYGFTKAGAAYAGEVRGGYAPVTVTPKTNMCGGKKKRRRKNKSRKSRRKSKKGGRRRKTKRSRRKRKKSRRKSKSRKNRRRRTRKRMKGGRYQQYASNVPITPSYSAPYTAGPMPWATGPVGINRKMNC
tara:strand:+ start:1316 stop:1954 length:639 start_codon:yes stop_codon:yes gene_type:complete